MSLDNVPNARPKRFRIIFITYYKKTTKESKVFEAFELLKFW